MAMEFMNPISSFKPGEKIFLYVEPVGFSYKPIKSLNLMNFTADLIVLIPKIDRHIA